ncbi:hypothetical protein THAOC_28269, partial [Thalassiosira oceanica]
MPLLYEPAATACYELDRFEKKVPAPCTSPFSPSSPRRTSAAVKSSAGRILNQEPAPRGFVQSGRNGRFAGRFELTQHEGVEYLRYLSSKLAFLLGVACSFQNEMAAQQIRDRFILRHLGGELSTDPPEFWHSRAPEVPPPFTPRSVFDFLGPGFSSPPRTDGRPGAPGCARIPPGAGPRSRPPAFSPAVRRPPEEPTAGRSRGRRIRRPRTAGRGTP